MIRRRLAGEQGIALVAAMMVMLLIALFTAVIAQSALDANDNSTRDRDSKRALAAAEAGMNTAFARLNSVTGLGDYRCFADSPIEAEGELQSFARLAGEVTINAGQCRPSSDERAGNGEFFHYYVSPVLSSSANGCNDPLGVGAGADRSSLLASGLVVLERCVTSVGTVHGVHRRVQRRAFATLQLFNAITADERLTASAGAALGGTRVQVNDAVQMADVAFAGEIVRYRGAPEPSMTNVTGAWTTTTRDRPFPLSPIDPEQKESAGPTSKTDRMSCAGPLLDLTCNNQGYDATRRSLRIPTGYTVTLTGGDYYLCELTVSGGTLNVSADANLYIDDPSRPGNACGAGATGQVSITGGLVNPVGALSAVDAAARMRVFAYGDPDATAVTISGTTALIVNGLFYAPQSHVVLQRDGGTGGPVVTGAISAREVAIAGELTTFTGVPDLPLPADGTVIPAVYAGGDWVECRSRLPSGRPHQDCR